RRLNRFCIGRQVNQGISGELSDGGSMMPKQVHKQRNGRRTDTPDDFKSLLMQVFITTVEEPSQQRPRTTSPVYQSGLGGYPNFRVVGQQAICPITHQGRIRGEGRLRRKRRCLGECDRLAKASSKYYCESSSLYEQSHLALSRTPGICL